MLRSLIFLIICLSFSSCILPRNEKRSVKKDSILFLEVKDIITSTTSEEFMSHVKDYVGSDHIKAVVVRVNSPGGTVGASQEINETIKDIREYYKKPVIVSAGDVMASGGVYSAMSADKIFVNRGTIFGSIGVIMQFSNLSELASWAKVEVYSLKAGEFKDSGSPFRKMTLRERELFENTLDNILEQFKSAIVEGRKLSEEVVNRIADGRVMTGEEALALGLVDEVGSLRTAIKEAGKLSGLGSHPEIFFPGEKTFLDKYFNRGKMSAQSLINKILNKFVTLSSISGQPLYILPSHLSPQ